jgi:hypothetical protein
MSNGNDEGGFWTLCEKNILQKFCQKESSPVGKGCDIRGLTLRRSFEEYLFYFSSHGKNHLKK